MASSSSNTGNIRKLVAIPYPLPEWISSALSGEFDFELISPHSTTARPIEVMLTSGTEDVGEPMLKHLPLLKYVCCIGSGYEGIDIDYAKERGISVSNSAAVTAEDVADHLVALVLGFCCAVPALDRAIREDRWHKRVRRSIRELKIGIFGFGAIGQAVAKRMVSFGPEIRWSGPREKQTPYAYCSSLLELANWADVLLVTARADQSNVGLIGDAVFERLGPEGIVANVSRGSILNEHELIAALKAGRLGGAVLDVFATEPTPAQRWANVPNTILSPHVGGYASGVRRGIVQLVQANLRAFFAGSALNGVIHTTPKRS